MEYDINLFKNLSTKIKYGYRFCSREGSFDRRARRGLWRTSNSGECGEEDFYSCTKMQCKRYKNR